MHAERPLPLVLLHAFPLNSRMWESLTARITDRPVIAPDLPGFGLRPPGPDSLQGFADLVLEELDGAGIGRAVFLGLSMGGYIAFRIWEDHPERVGALILADTRAGSDTAEAAAKRERQAERARREGIEWLPEAMLESVLGETTREDRPQVVERVRSMMLEANGEGVARALLAMRSRPDSTPLLSSIDVPVLVLVGDEDRITDLAEARKIVAGVEGADLRVISRAGHLSNLENPDDFETAVLEFLSRVPGS